MRFEVRAAALDGLPRIAAVAVLFTLALTLGIETHLYATALVSLIVGVILLLVESRSPSTGRDHARAAVPPVSENDYLQCMLDTVNAALIVLDDEDRATLVNRAAQRLSTASIYRLAQMPLLDRSTAARLERIPAGQSDVIELTDGQAVLASVSEFRAQGHARRRLIALQRIASDLERVQLKAWRDVMGTLAHEMMNSLTPIASLAESLQQRMQQTPEDSTVAIAAPAIEAIARRSRGLLEFVQRYREVSEVPAARIQMIQASAFAPRLEKLIGPLAAGRHIQFECRLDAAEQDLALDPALTEQAVVNLLLNAMDAVDGTPEASVLLEIQAVPYGIEIAVIDNGAGVDPANRAQLFVPFFTTKPEGSGIGLNLARNIALAHGGQLTYQPRTPRGSVFTLAFPKPA